MNFKNLGNEPEVYQQYRKSLAKELQFNPIKATLVSDQNVHDLIPGEVFACSEWGSDEPLSDILRTVISIKKLNDPNLPAGYTPAPTLLVIVTDHTDKEAAETLFRMVTDKELGSYTNSTEIEKVLAEYEFDVSNYRPINIIIYYIPRSYNVPELMSTYIDGLQNHCELIAVGIDRFDLPTARLRAIAQKYSIPIFVAPI